MTKQVAEKVAEVLKAVAHPVRLQIVDTLEQGERCVSEIMAAVGGKQAITSQQLNMMRIKGVLGARRQGNKVYYRIVNANVIKLLHCMSQHCDTGQDRS